MTDTAIVPTPPSSRHPGRIRRAEHDRAAASDVMDAKFAVESLAQEDDLPGDELRDALERLAAQLPDASGCQA